MVGGTKRLRFVGHGAGLRLRTRGDWEHDYLDGIRECCRASMALDKALGEAIRRSVAGGASWGDIGRALGVSETADTDAEVMDALAASKRLVWSKFWR